MAEEIKPGDLVELKSGGPPMTVEREMASDPGSWACSWFVGAEKRSEIFNAAALKKYVEPSGPRGVSFTR